MFLVTLLQLACAPAPAPVVSEPLPAAVEATPPAPERSRPFADTLAALDAELAGLERRIDQRSPQWLLESQLAQGLLQRARLTGDLDDYVDAQAAIDRAFAIAPEGSGPFLARASLNYTLHRLDRVEGDLVRAERAILVSDDTRAAILRLRAGLLLQRGFAGGAAALYEQAQDLDETSSGHGSLAMAQLRQGKWTEAEASLDAAEASYHGRSVEPLAWITLHRGIFDLERDRLDEALAHYEDALAIMPGWWLAEEHVAEIHVLQGRGDQAVAMYEDIVARTGLPEFMDAIAGVLEAKGDDDGARTWRLRARSVYERQLALFPEAAAGHALGHYLEAGDSVVRAVALAESNAELRPNAEALALLAEAYEAAGRTADARWALQRASTVD